MTTVTIIIPAWNEEKALPGTINNVLSLDPPADELILVDGGSEDRTCELAQEADIKVLISPQKGRAAQINFGADAATGDVICILHADTVLPVDAITEIRKTLTDPTIVMASFTPRIAGPKGTRWGTTFHNYIKTWYTPLIFRPRLFMGGLRLLFGDHAMFFRRAQFWEVGGCDDSITIMEEADLCISLSRLGRTKMIPRWVWTSDRRITEWGALKANFIYFKVGVMWAFGARQSLTKHYPDVRS